jgi:hypothetical protein
VSRHPARTFLIASHKIIFEKCLCKICAARFVVFR